MSSTLNILFTDGVFISWKHSFVFFLPQLFLIWFHNFFLQNDLFPTFLVQYGANVHWISLAFSLIMLHTLKCCIVNETNTAIFVSQKNKNIAKKRWWHKFCVPCITMFKCEKYNKDTNTSHHRQRWQKYNCHNKSNS